jgi:hypothetical protein
MAVTVTLQQERSVLGSKYRVRSTVISAIPDGLYAVFVLTAGLTVVEEEYLRVATLDDLVSYVEVPLIRLEAASPGEFLGITPGDTLNITNAISAAPAWFDTNFITATFTVAGVDITGAVLEVVATKPFPTAVTGLAWSCGALSGVDAICYRSDPTKLTWLRRNLVTLFGDVAEASSHATAIQTMLDKLVLDSKTHGTQFIGVDNTVHTA